jgi:hypothetical protein
MPTVPAVQGRDQPGAQRIDRRVVFAGRARQGHDQQQQGKQTAHGTTSMGVILAARIFARRHSWPE